MSYIAVLCNSRITAEPLYNTPLRITPSEFFKLFCGPTRGHSLKLYCPDSTINIRVDFFTVRVIKVWNKLPPSIVVADSVTSFVWGLNSLSSDFYCV